MKVILLESIPSVGNLGDVINVRPGFARNYLFPQGKAERASAAAVESFAHRRAELEKRQKEQSSAMQKARDVLDGYTLQLTARASPDRNLYGSITAQIITAALNKQNIVDGLVVKRAQVVLADGPLKELGEHAVTVNLSSGLQARVNVSVMTESDATTAETAAKKS